MNCPSRTDDNGLNPGWNQNPPHFASDITTCQDMNGIVNSRELLDRDVNGAGEPGSGSQDSGGGFTNTRPPEQQDAMGAEGPIKG